MATSAMLAVSVLGKKLYSKAVGSTNAWQEFSPQPAWDAGGDGPHFVVGLPGGGIITDRGSATNQYAHYSPVTNSWTYFNKPSHAGVYSVPRGSWAVSDNLVVTVSNALVDIWNGSSWTAITNVPNEPTGPTNPTCRRIAATSTTNIWVMGSSGTHAGESTVSVWDGATWTNHYSSILAIQPLFGWPRGLFAIGTLIFVIGSSGYMFRYDGSWLQIGTVIAGIDYLYDGWGLTNNFWLPARGGNAPDIWHRHDGIWTQEYDALVWYGAPLDGQSIYSDSTAQEVWACVGAGTTLFCTFNGGISGATWTTSAWIDGNAIDALGAQEAYTGCESITCSKPSIGSDFTLNHYNCLRSQFSNRAGQVCTPAAVPFSLAHQAYNIRNNTNKPVSGSLD